MRLNYKDIKSYVENNTTAKLLSTKYINSTSKLLFKCECGRDFERTWNKFKYSDRTLCRICAEEIRKENSKTSVKDILKYFDNTESKYINKETLNGKTILSIECECGEKYTQVLSEFKNSKYKVCSKCSRRLKGLESRLSTDAVKSELKSYGIELLDDYNGIDINMSMMCSCGKPFISSLWKVRISDNKVCPICLTGIRSNDRKKRVEDFIKELEIKKPYIKLVGEFNGMNVKTQFKFITCGHIDNRKPKDIIKHKNTQCNICKMSSGESKIKLFLDENHIEYTPQKTFEDCFNIKKLRFDFYLPKYNMCIEYQGHFHFEKEVLKRKDNVFGGIKEFLLGKKRDLIKKRFCRKNNIAILEIMYYEYDNINKILKCSLKR